MVRFFSFLLSIPLGAVIFTVAAWADTIPDYPLPDTGNKTIRISDYRGKIVLVEFWASWCGPCRASNPDLKQTREKFLPNGFEIISVSVDKNSQAWLRAVQEDGLDWPQLLDYSDRDTSYADLLGVEALPHNFLIDRQGNLLYQNLDVYSLDKMLGLIFGNETGFFPDSTAGLLVFRQPSKYTLIGPDGKKIRKGYTKELDLHGLTPGNYILHHHGGTDTVKVLFQNSKPSAPNAETLCLNEWGVVQSSDSPEAKGVYYLITEGRVEKKVIEEIKAEAP